MTMHTAAISPSRIASRGFTLIELMVVMIMISILIAIVLTVGSRVVENQRRKTTENVIRVLDAMVDEYTAQTQDRVPAFYVTQPPSTATGNDAIASAFPIFDGRPCNAAGAPLITDTDSGTQPSLSLLFMAISQRLPIEPLLKSIDPTMLRPAPAPLMAAGWRNGAPNPAAFTLPLQGAGNGPLYSPVGLVVNDSWGRPIRFVHPRFSGLRSPVLNGTVAPSIVTYPIANAQAGTQQPIALGRRVSAAPAEFREADGGVCPGGRAYFYSVGRDGDPATHGDNVYTITPIFPAGSLAFDS